jgi:hypothetical protein
MDSGACESRQNGRKAAMPKAAAIAIFLCSAIFIVFRRAPIFHERKHTAEGRAKK